MKYCEEQKDVLFSDISKFETWLILRSLNHKLIGEGRGERRKTPYTQGLGNSSSIPGIPSPRAVEFGIKWKDTTKLKCGWK